MSQGFHPKPRMSFPSALAVGAAGLQEVMEAELAEPYTAQQIQERLPLHLLPGLTLCSVEILPPGTPKARVRSTTWEVPLPPARLAETASRIGRLTAPPGGPARDGAVAPPPHGGVEEISLCQGVLHMRLRAGPGRVPGPRDVLAALGLDDLEPGAHPLTRTIVELEP